MTIHEMAFVRISTVAQCICDHCGHVFEVDWDHRTHAVYCPGCKEKVSKE